MEKTNPTQLELFSRTGEPAARPGPENNTAFFKFIRIYEKTILIIIGVIITGVVAFSMGVERGKKISALRDNARFDMALEPQKQLPQQIPLNSAAPEPVTIIAPAAMPNKGIQLKSADPVQERPQGSYTIQLASYRARSMAEKEAQRLRKAGHKTLILAKKEYVVLCVGNFTKKDLAKQLLSQLEKKYPTCYIRKL